MDNRLERIDEAAPIFDLPAASCFGNLLLICYRQDMPCRPEQNRLFYKSIQRICLDQNVKLVELPGTHCQGSTERNSRGGFDYVDALLKFIEAL